MTALRVYAEDSAPLPGTVAWLVDAVIAARQADVAARLISPVALRQWERYARLFAKDFGGKPLASCRRADLVAWLGKHPEWKAASTQHDACAAIVCAFSRAVEEGLLELTPYKMPRGMPAAQPRAAMTYEEFRRILTAARYHGRGDGRARKQLRLLLWFCWEVGCRPGEARAILWDQYDDARGCFELPGKTTRRTGRKRLLVLSRRAWRLIRWLRRRCATGPVFVNGQGRPWGSMPLVNIFNRYAAKAGIREELTAYSLRHGFCCERLQAGVGERQVADLMGHTSTKLIEWYGRGVKSNVDYLRSNLEKRKD